MADQLRARIRGGDIHVDLPPRGKIIGFVVAYIDSDDERPVCHVSTQTETDDPALQRAVVDAIHQGVEGVIRRRGR